MAIAMRPAAMKPAIKPAMKAAMKPATKPPAMKPAAITAIQAMKAMKAKAIKAMNAMKAMKVKKVSIIAKGKLAKSRVFKGLKEKTVGGLTKATLVKSRSGKVVSKAASARGKKNYANSAIKKWADAAKQARKDMKIKGFCPIGGSTAEGKALYAKVKAILSK